jgi:hypothetical protein
VSHLVRLAVLDLRNNRLTSVTRQAAQLPRLEKLDLRWNEIDVADPAVGLLEARECRVLL